MANYQDIVEQIKNIDNPVDVIRKECLNDLSDITKRNIICYYSSWLQKSDNPNNTSINDLDIIGFIETVHTLDKNKGLDLILHTPGGDPTAAEAIGN